MAKESLVKGKTYVLPFNLVKFGPRIMLGIVATLMAGVFFSYKLLEVPPGLTVDEAAFGYNAILLANTLHDQNNRFLPFFVLSIEGKDWRQPVTQYYITFFFKLFGASIFNLRLTSVLVVLMSAVILAFLSLRLGGIFFSFVATFVFLTTPLVMIQSHMALDNIIPILFALLWLLNIFLFAKKDQRRYLFLGGIALGIGFYSYKAMRLIVPVWFFLTIVYLGLELVNKRRVGEFLKSIVIFALGVCPFFVIIPVLERLYPGAVFGQQQAAFGSWYSFLYPYLASYDLSFLFIKGDQTYYHSTGTHGMLLLASLPLFAVGFYQAVKKGNYWWLILLAFSFSPLLFGSVGSVHRASRLMALIPFYSFISALGATWLWEKRNAIVNTKIFLVAILSLMVINYYDFVRYYWFTYPLFVQNLFGNLSMHKSYQLLALEAKKNNLVPYITKDVYVADGEHAHFYEALYFGNPVQKWENNDLAPPPGSILLTNREVIPGMEKLKIIAPAYRLQVN